METDIYRHALHLKMKKLGLIPFENTPHRSTIGCKHPLLSNNFYLIPMKPKPFLMYETCLTNIDVKNLQRKTLSSTWDLPVHSWEGNLPKVDMEDYEFIKLCENQYFSIPTASQWRFACLAGAGSLRECFQEKNMRHLPNRAGRLLPSTSFPPNKYSMRGMLCNINEMVEVGKVIQSIGSDYTGTDEFCKNYSFSCGEFFKGIFWGVRPVINFEGVKQITINTYEELL